MSTHDAPMSPPSRTPAGGPSRRGLLAGGGAAALAAAAVAGASPAQAAGPAAPGAPGRDRTARTAARTRDRAAGARKRTKIGMGYQTWFMPGVGQWQTPEAKPLLGHYSSLDEKVIKRHAEWLTWAGIDYLLLDWSNNLGGNWTNDTAAQIIKGTDALLSVYAKLKKRPQLTLLLGMDDGKAGTEHFLAQIEEVKKRIAKYPDLWLKHEGKPLLNVFTGANLKMPPDWNDDYFTLRWQGAFREIVLNPGGQWSWKDRVPFANGPEKVVADFRFGDAGLDGWKAQGPWRVDKVPTGPSFDNQVEVRCVSIRPTDGEQQAKGRLTSPPFRITEPVLSFNAIGTDMAAYDKLPSLDGRNAFLLSDAKTGEVLRHASPPGEPGGFHVRQWNVRELLGREVVFEVVNNNDFPANLGWCGVDRVFQQSAEQVAVVPASAGNHGPGSYDTWDADSREHGATYVSQFTGVFDWEPEFVQICAWNEFGAPDQFSTAASNDIEPTVVTRLKGKNSDGWGYYYLDLTRDLIDQYRAGAEFPNVKLDLRYP
ncbi:hypothetical protein OG892_30925 [Streptomyces sp. NBC_00341]|uniref:hypothetical protein n=1 Tax=Streptomyces sp. NBC_00341 TaxID=2975717 RepID=UPI003085ED92|nr:hypothetical protein OG892_30925 [Streptomyces sp. NBC_00341]